MKKFNGKAIYNPSGAAGEYSYWGCNLVVGCSNGCEYCYCKKGILKGVMGMDKPQLKKCLVDEITAFDIFKKEVLINKTELQIHGLFFSFTTDPMLPEFENLTWRAIMFCNEHNIPVKVLTKLVEWVEDTLHWLEHSNSDNQDREWRKLIAFGVTLTGRDDKEPGASTNNERIEGLKLLHAAGFPTFVSIEPIVDFKSSRKMIEATLAFCDLYKIGLMSGTKYDKKETAQFIQQVAIMTRAWQNKIYFKDSIIKQADVLRSNLPNNCVTRKYNLFTGADTCMEKCESCEKQFDIDEMHKDDDSNWFCTECWTELAPVMKAEYEEMVHKGDIEA